MEAIKPDYAVLVVNPEVDEEKYIQDTVNCLESVFKCKVIAMAFSDKMIITKRNVSYRQKRTAQNITQVSKELRVNYGMDTGCINDAAFVESIVKTFIQKVGGT